MNGTCSKDCALWDKYGTACPNYLKTVFVPDTTKIPEEVEDCTPKRCVLMLQQIHNRMEEFSKLLSGHNTNYANLFNSFMEVMQHVVNSQVRTLPMGRVVDPVGGSESAGDLHQTVDYDPEKELQ